MSVLVFMVTSGYSADYRVEGIFSTREKAEAFEAELAKIDADHDIEEVEVDAEVGKLYQSIFSVDIEIDGGSLSRSWRLGRIDVVGYSRVYQVEGMGIIRAESTASEAHAIEIATAYRMGSLPRV